MRSALFIQVRPRDLLFLPAPQVIMIRSEFKMPARSKTGRLHSQTGEQTTLGLYGLQEQFLQICNLVILTCAIFASQAGISQDTTTYNSQWLHNSPPPVSNQEPLLQLYEGFVDTINQSRASKNRDNQQILDIQNSMEQRRKRIIIENHIEGNRTDSTPKEERGTRFLTFEETEQPEFTSGDGWMMLRSEWQNIHGKKILGSIHWLQRLQHGFSLDIDFSTNLREETDPKRQIVYGLVSKHDNNQLAPKYGKLDSTQWTIKKLTQPQIEELQRRKSTLKKEEAWRAAIMKKNGPDRVSKGKKTSPVLKTTSVPLPSPRFSFRAAPYGELGPSSDKPDIVFTLVQTERYYSLEHLPGTHTHHLIRIPAFRGSTIERKLDKNGKELRLSIVDIKLHSKLPLIHTHYEKELETATLHLTQSYRSSWKWLHGGIRTHFPTTDKEQKKIKDVTLEISAGF